MSFLSWLGSAIRNRDSATGIGMRKPKTGSPKPLRFRPQLEVLEGRDVPSTLTVTNLNDNNVGATLRNEVTVAQSGDSIVFAKGLTGAIPLYEGELLINKNLAIEG